MVVASLENTKDAARRFYDTLNEALATGNLALLDEVIAPNAVDHNPAPGQGPGLEGIKRSFGEFRAAFSELRLTVEDILAEGETAACRITTRGTHRGEFQGIAPTAKQVSQSGIDILRFADGKLVERWGHFDDLGLWRQLGVVPAGQ